MSDTIQGTIHEVCLGTLLRVRHEIIQNTRTFPIVTHLVKNIIDDVVWMGVVASTLENLPSERPM